MEVWEKLTEAASLGEDALHISLGLGVMLLVAIGLRRPLGDWRPIAVVTLVSLAGAIWGAIDSFAHAGTPRWRADWTMVLHTLFWPATLFLLARFTSLLRR